MNDNRDTSVLVVDDTEANLLTYEGILEDLHLNLVKAHSGEEALRHVFKEDFAAILMDVQMPGMDGFETAATIRKRRRSQETPLLFVTAVFPHEPYVSRGYSLGAVDYLTKPLVPEILRAKVAVFVELFRKRQELASANAELQKAKEAAEEANRIKSRSNKDLETLLYVISHDLREPLRGVRNFAHLVTQRCADRLDDKGKDFLCRIGKGAERLDHLLEDILVLSRAQRLTTPAEPIDGSAIVADVLSRLEEMVQRTKATIRVSPELPQLYVDRMWARQAVYNLVCNALKFTRDGEAPDVEIAPYNGRGAAEDRRGVGLVVRDRGPGVAPEHAERIFQLFQRAVGREVEGTGAGLAIVQAIAQRHGGRAWVQPRPGGGSEFVITFPAA